MFGRLIESVAGIGILLALWYIAPNKWPIMYIPWLILAVLMVWDEWRQWRKWWQVARS